MVVIPEVVDLSDDEEYQPRSQPPLPERVDDNKKLSKRVIKAFHTASITFKYLKGNSTSHKTPFSALAELTDNSLDAKAKHASIKYVERDGFKTIEVLDDGIGMTKEEVLKTMVFGHSDKLVEHDKYIGRYGNGLKAGGFRIGGDLLLVTKKAGTSTVLLVSTKFHEEEDVDGLIVVPTPSFDEYKLPITDDIEIHDAEVRTIKKYGPLGRGETVESLLDRIPGNSGTLIIISSLKMGLVGELEFTICDKKKDLILQTNGDEGEEWETSLRHYMSRLYYQSAMNISVQGALIEPHILPEFWMFRRMKTLENIHLPEQWANYGKEIDAEVERLGAVQRELTNKIGEFNSRERSVFCQSENVAFRKVTEKYEEVKKQLVDAENKKKTVRSLKGAKVDVNFGLNVKERSNNGIYFFVNGRLIIGGFKNKKVFDQNGYMGVCAIVHLTYLTLQPSSDKQGFHSNSDFKVLVKSIEKGLERYVHYLGEEAVPQLAVKKLGITQDCVSTPDDAFSLFWSAFGYTKNPVSRSTIDWELPTKPSEAIDEDCRFWKQCSECHHWKYFHEKPKANVYTCRLKCSITSDNVIWKPLKEPKEQKKPTMRLPPPPNTFQTSAISSMKIPRRSNKQPTKQTEQSKQVEAKHDILLDDFASGMEDAPREEPTIPTRPVRRNARRGNGTEEKIELIDENPQVADSTESDEEEEYVPSTKKTRTSNSSGAVARRSKPSPAAPSPPVVKSSESSMSVAAASDRRGSSSSMSSVSGRRGSSSSAATPSNNRPLSTRMAKRTGKPIFPGSPPPAQSAVNRSPSPAPISDDTTELNSVKKLIGDFMKELKKLGDPRLEIPSRLTDPVAQLATLTEQLKRSSINN